MSKIKRTQLIIQTLEGDVVTSVQLEFDGVINEYITTDGLAWLIEATPRQIEEFMVVNELIMRERHGQLWVNCSGLLPLFGWTPDQKRG